jgi:putative hemolysin
MKNSRNYFSIVPDEYGGMSGIVTMNDLLEQIVGNLENDDSIPLESPLIEKIDSKTWKIHGTVSPEFISEQIGVIV